jgi:hypothetical protein
LQKTAEREAPPEVLQGLASTTVPRVITGRLT